MAIKTIKKIKKQHYLLEINTKFSQNQAKQKLNVSESKSKFQKLNWNVTKTKHDTMDTMGHRWLDDEIRDVRLRFLKCVFNIPMLIIVLWFVLIHIIKSSWWWNTENIKYRRIFFATC